MLFAPPASFLRHRFFILESYHDGVWTRNYCNNIQYCMAKHKKVWSSIHWNCTRTEGIAAACLLLLPLLNLKIFAQNWEKGWLPLPYYISGIVKNQSSFSLSKFCYCNFKLRKLTHRLRRADQMSKKLMSSMQTNTFCSSNHAGNLMG